MEWGIGVGIGSLKMNIAHFQAASNHGLPLAQGVSSFQYKGLRLCHAPCLNRVKQCVAKPHALRHRLYLERLDCLAWAA